MHGRPEGWLTKGHLAALLVEVAQGRDLEQYCVCNDGRERRDRAPVFPLTNIRENPATEKSCLRKSNIMPTDLCQFTYTRTKPVWKLYKQTERNTLGY